jgi:hypothetical protein
VRCASASARVVGHASSPTPSSECAKVSDTGLSNCTPWSIAFLLWRLRRANSHAPHVGVSRCIEPGVDIVLGHLNARASDQLDHLLRGFEHLPNSKATTNKGLIDVAGAIRRKPSVLLIDTRPPALFGTSHGSTKVRNFECWSEIDAIAEAGIDVWAAVDASGFSSWSSVGPGLPARITGESLL